MAKENVDQTTIQETEVTVMLKFNMAGETDEDIKEKVQVLGHNVFDKLSEYTSDWAMDWKPIFGKSKKGGE